MIRDSGYAKYLPHPAVTIHQLQLKFTGTAAYLERGHSSYLSIQPAHVRSTWLDKVVRNFALDHETSGCTTTTY